MTHLKLPNARMLVPRPMPSWSDVAGKGRGQARERGFGRVNLILIEHIALVISFCKELSICHIHVQKLVLKLFLWFPGILFGLTGHRGLEGWPFLLVAELLPGDYPKKF